MLVVIPGIGLPHILEERLLEKREARPIETLGMDGIVHNLEAHQPHDFRCSRPAGKQGCAGLPAVGIGPEMVEILESLFLEGGVSGPVPGNLDGIFDLKGRRS